MGYIAGCRMCGGQNVERFLDLGRHTLMNSLVRPDDLDGIEDDFPLEVGFCHDCHLVQLMYIVAAETIYQAQDYLFYSSDMPTLRDYFEEYAAEVYEKYLAAGELLVEIGSNDGILLALFPPGIRTLGVDPSTNVVLRALRKGHPTVSAFFNSQIARQIEYEWGKAKIITGSNCIAHLDDLDDMMDGVVRLLTDDGVLCVEANYWGGMVRNLNYSLIYLDHFSFFSLEVWQTFARKFGMEVFDAYITAAQGGSMRLFLDRGGRARTERLGQLAESEEKTKLNSFETAQDYAKRVNARRDEIAGVLKRICNAGKTIAGYGAAAKGLSILRSSNIDGDTIKFIVDDSEPKQGLFTPWSRIPVVARSAVADPDYFMILAPNYARVIMEKERSFAEKGGKFIVPGDEVRILPE